MSRSSEEHVVVFFGGTSAEAEVSVVSGTAIAEASVGEGKVVLLGPEVAFRAQPHGTFKLLFNGLYYGSAKSAELK